jgi:hypothetical protein
MTDHPEHPPNAVVGQLTILKSGGGTGGELLEMFTTCPANSRQRT